MLIPELALSINVDSHTLRLGRAPKFVARKPSPKFLTNLVLKMEISCPSGSTSQCVIKPAPMEALLSSNRESSMRSDAASNTARPPPHALASPRTNLLRRTVSESLVWTKTLPPYPPKLSFCRARPKSKPQSSTRWSPSASIATWPPRLPIPPRNRMPERVKSLPDTNRIWWPGGMALPSTQSPPPQQRVAREAAMRIVSDVATFPQMATVSSSVISSVTFFNVVASAMHGPVVGTHDTGSAISGGGRHRPEPSGVGAGVKKDC
mmetsp:Transcript_27594/g.81157  ORF Transcript_27594/g.81157 Transcript_27594/m.81157 type:complete len:264 (+) Transcript_27594:191-982(+)